MDSSGLENILQVPANRAKVAQNHDARKAVSAKLTVRRGLVCVHLDYWRHFILRLKE